MCFKNSTNLQFNDYFKGKGFNRSISYFVQHLASSGNYSDIKTRSYMLRENKCMPKLWPYAALTFKRATVTNLSQILQFIQRNLILYGRCIILKYICKPTRYVMFCDWVYSQHLVARHVSNLNGPSSGAFTSCMLRIWYVGICVFATYSL